MVHTVASLKCINAEKFQAAHHQITRHLRQEIISGRIPAGGKLPSVPELARMWSVSSFTVHTALTPLVEAGLLIRQPGRGTFVAEKKRELSCAAIYYAADFFGKTEAVFYNILHQRLGQELAAQNIRMRTWIDPRAASEQSEPYEPLMEAIRNNEVQCLIAPLLSKHDFASLKRLSVPSVFLTSGNTPNKVGFEPRQFFELSMESLSQKGCRSVALLTAYRTTQKDPRENFYPRFVEAAKKFGIQTKKEWILAPKKELSLAGMERFGYDCIQQLRNTTERPEGLIVYPDTMVRGVVMGLMPVDSVSQSFHLVLHRNKGAEIFCPLPATWIVSDPEQVARALICQIHKRFTGEVVDPINVPYMVSVETRPN